MPSKTPPSCFVTDRLLWLRPQFDDLEAALARSNFLFTSESVGEGHPDKLCDRISDEVVDLFFREGAAAGIDPYSIRVACETLATTNRVVIAGEVRGPNIDPEGRSRRPPAPPSRISATSRTASIGSTAKVEILLHAQSADIAQGVDSARATRTKAPAIRASCSAMPAARRRS